MTPEMKPLKPAGFAGAPLRTALAHMTGLALVSTVLLAGGGHARAQSAHAWPGLKGEPDGERVNVSLGGSAGGPSRNLSLPKGKSAVIELPVDARDVMVSNPKVADVVLSTPRRIYVLGQDGGQTDATFIDGMGRQILRLNIRVDNDTSAVAETLNHILPGSSIHVEAVNDRLILSGEAPSAGDADKALRVAQSFVEKPEDVLNMISVAEPEQVMLKVRIVEVNRQIIKQLGVNLQALVGQVGGSQFSIGNAPTYGVNGSFLGGFSGGYQVNTTSQPAAASSLSALGLLFPGLSQASGVLAGAQAAGIGLSSIGTIVSTFLTGGSGLSTAQSSFSQTYLNGLLGNVSTNYTPIVGTTTLPTETVTAASAGISASNLQSLSQGYLNGGVVPNGLVNAGTVLTGPQRAWFNAFYTQLPSYNAALANTSSSSQTVNSGLAGSKGLNQGESMLQAYEQTGLIRTLAEPNLTAISGESAKFLAGGEFPVPVSEDNNGRVTVEFKQFGVGLGFTPVVLSNGRISLKLSTEYSELTNVGGFTLSNSNTTTSGTTSSAPGLSIPGLNVRRAETVVEMPSGGAMMIAGLLESVNKQSVASLPGLNNLPVLGALFRSRDFLEGETELVVIVMPVLVKSTRPDLLQTPADGLQVADDPSAYLLGRLNKSITSNPAPPPAAVQSYKGPFGYVVE